MSEKSQGKRYQGLTKITRSIRNVTKPILGARGFSNTDIIENWNDIIGDDLAQGIAPIKIAFRTGERVKGTLHVKSAGGAFAMLCEHQKDRIMARINSYFGYPAVAGIKIIQGALKLQTPKVAPKPEKKVPQSQIDKLKSQTSKIENEELRNLAYEIGLSILKK
ncbi:MAG: DciA family protein [Lactobacillales bacterium]|jgi:hypothetical protein|nr:DciA family protein [Lactobacillales bacterium]